MKKGKQARAVELGQRLRGWRMENGVGLRRLADILGVSERSVVGWELGEFYPGFDALGRLADGMGVSVDWLMGRCSCWKTADQVLREQHRASQ